MNRVTQGVSYYRLVRTLPSYRIYVTMRPGEMVLFRGNRFTSDYVYLDPLTA